MFRLRKYLYLCFPPQVQNSDSKENEIEWRCKTKVSVFLGEFLRFGNRI